jgi:hypothetical protein
MKILITLPDCNYYLWQMLVQINNFRKMGFENDTTYLIGKTNIQPSSTLKKIMSGGIKSNFYVMNDERKDPKYSPSLKPFLMKKYFELHPEKETYFYTDPDVIFTKKLKLTDLGNDDIWYLSDAKSYLNSKYIKSKSEELFKEMCQIVGIEPEIVEKNDNDAGGAQLIVKNTTPEFWDKVEKDSEKLYQLMISTSNKYNPEYPIQAWTAEMWSTLWNSWLFGHETKIIKKMNFSWATDPIKKWGESSIYHNAGAVIDNGTYFLKTKYQMSPFNKDIKCTDTYCSYNYVKEIKETEKNFKNILF